MEVRASRTSSGLNGLIIAITIFMCLIPAWRTVAPESTSAASRMVAAGRAESLPRSSKLPNKRRAKPPDGGEAAEISKF